MGTSYHGMHCCDVIMRAVASQITSLTIVYSTVYPDADQRKKHQSSTSLAFVWGIHRGPVNSPHKWPVTRKCFHLMTSSWKSAKFKNFGMILRRQMECLDNKKNNQGSAWATWKRRSFYLNSFAFAYHLAHWLNDAGYMSFQNISHREFKYPVCMRMNVIIYLFFWTLGVSIWGKYWVCVIIEWLFCLHACKWWCFTHW